MSPKVTTKSDFLTGRDVDTAKFHAPAESLKIDSFGKTDIGQRPSNQDQFVIAKLMKVMQVTQSSFPHPEEQIAEEHGHLFVVADGVGGSAGGEEASRLAIDAVEDFLLDTLRWFFCLSGDEAHVLAEFQQALGQADAKLYTEASERPELEGMGTTLTMAFLLQSQLFIAHAGDSRCYLFRDGKLYQITKDHTMVAALVEQGVLDPEEAIQSPFSNVITNSLGGKEPGLRVDVHKLSVASGDRLLLCSDGLTREVDNHAIASTLQDAEPQTACEELVELAKDRGGKDNITSIVVRLSVMDPGSFATI